MGSNDYRYSKACCKEMGLGNVSFNYTCGINEGRLDERRKKDVP